MSNPLMPAGPCGGAVIQEHLVRSAEVRPGHLGAQARWQLCRVRGDCAVWCVVGAFALSNGLHACDGCDRPSKCLHALLLA